ncbi:ANTAR domain protein with unknown sensor [Kribbella flavida DSM 17836]|uniref:ANTAR domain-containing protein n=1 Tax=Kribbella flavida (strain DSM 17836 / JCM 10339 / NBRC 14399) TaxID=479435 RepID=D2PPN5_KRIFD|nr:GAF and ANTAR domain-containing protein [Kribbella flavida]ADB30997.1 ANTAR domain protein with unknown sensor [Kribbella flavida DSM 17836]
MTDELATGGTADQFAELALELHASDGVTETIDTVLAFALDAVGCAQAGAALLNHGRLEIAAVTDPVIERIYRFQLDRGEGPLIAAQEQGKPVRIPDTAQDDRWPAWAAMVSTEGLRSVLQLPLVISGRTVGVLSLHSTKADGFDADDEAVAHILARHASVAVAAARQQQTLVEAVDARKLIGQAMGILMERFAVDADRAFAILRRYSQDNNVKLRTVAEELIRTRRLPG